MNKKSEAPKIAVKFSPEARQKPVDGHFLKRERKRTLNFGPGVHEKISANS